jgi:pimeloyl-ACP methyl ester carboxylesterase
MPWEYLGITYYPLWDAGKLTGSPLLENLLFIATLLAALASANGCINDAARAWFSLGRDRYLPSWFSAVHPKYRTPYRSILFLLPIALAFAFIADLNQAITFSILSGVLQYTFMSINIMMFRKKWPLGTIRRGYTHPFHPIPAIVLFPQCAPTKFWAEAPMDEMVMRQIEALSEDYAVDQQRNYLLGVSMGGYGVWHFAARYPQKFAALVAICGGSPLTSGDRFKPIAEKVGTTPAWLFHGAEDKVVQVSESRSMVAAIKANQGSVKYSEYAEVGHNVWLNALGEKDLLPWILAQKLDQK